MAVFQRHESFAFIYYLIYITSEWPPFVPAQDDGAKSVHTDSAGRDDLVLTEVNNQSEVRY